jgi:hypothetical protein
MLPSHEFVLPDLSFAKNRDEFYLAYLRILMSHINEDGSVGPSKLSMAQRRRLTHQSISALLTCGFPKESPVLQRSYQWLVNSRDPERHGEDNFYLAGSNC